MGCAVGFVELIPVQLHTILLSVVVGTTTASESETLRQARNIQAVGDNHEVSSAMDRESNVDFGFHFGLDRSGVVVSLASSLVVMGCTPFHNDRFHDRGLDVKWIGKIVLDKMQAHVEDFVLVCLHSLFV